LLKTFDITLPGVNRSTTNFACSQRDDAISWISNIFWSDPKFPRYSSQKVWRSSGNEQ